MLELKLGSLKKNKVFIHNLRLDVTPEIMLKPRFITEQNRDTLIKEIQGFSFYIDYFEGLSKKPVLMIMKTYCLASKTIAEVTDTPEELLWECVREQGKLDNGLYAVQGRLVDWIKRELGVA